MARLVGSLCGLSLSLALASSAWSETSIVPASADNTLIESPTGALSNGAGPAFFVGRNSQASNYRRRGLIRFDVASALPAGVIVTRAELRLVLTPSNLPPIEIALHRVLSDWGEGESSASGGGGDEAAPGDATWLHTFFDDELWVQAGGDFSAAASAALEVGSESGEFVWPSTPATVEDVQAWLDFPEHDHGWLLRSAEDVPTSAKRFASREEEDPALRPQLVVEYVYPCDTLLLEAETRALCSAYCEALDCDTAHFAAPRACEQIARRFAQATGGVTLPCPPTGRGPSGGLPQIAE